MIVVVRHILRVLIALTSAMVLTAGLPSSSASAAADVRTFKFPPLTRSPQFLYGGCPYKILYGKFGNAVFAQVAVYSGCSAPMNVAISSTAGGLAKCDGQSSHCPVRGGQDGCGTYLWWQATLEVTQAEQARNMAVAFPDGSVRYFHPTQGDPVSGRNC
ncbi:hypothetical protein OHA25_60245 (plasmid) [Nonomuraea sp. NBC_00507]|uniref:hypothetical protein n=1 Tax=Nonomuraea sp. NBC_00507 TaxID=2976002 RepID=UPI002E183706